MTTLLQKESYGQTIEWSPAQTEAGKAAITDVLGELPDLPATVDAQTLNAITSRYREVRDEPN